MIMGCQFQGKLAGFVGRIKNMKNRQEIATTKILVAIKNNSTIQG
jgi:hypothetical protein